MLLFLSSVLINVTLIFLVLIVKIFIVCFTHLYLVFSRSKFYQFCGSDIFLINAFLSISTVIIHGLNISGSILLFMSSSPLICIIIFAFQWSLPLNAWQSFMYTVWFIFLKPCFLHWLFCFKTSNNSLLLLELCPGFLVWYSMSSMLNSFILSFFSEFCLFLFSGLSKSPATTPGRLWMISSAYTTALIQQQHKSCYLVISSRLHSIRCEVKEGRKYNKAKMSDVRKCRLKN